LPDSSLVFKNKIISGGKMDKERLTCLICAGMARERGRLHVTGK
jgi:phosphoribosyl-dephospho-CoA transferase